MEIDEISEIFYKNTMMETIENMRDKSEEREFLAHSQKNFRDRIESTNKRFNNGTN